MGDKKRAAQKHTSRPNKKGQIKPTPATDLANEALDKGGRNLDCYQSVRFIISILFEMTNHDFNEAEGSFSS